MNEYAIKNIHGREILDSRGNPTVEVDVILEKYSNLDVEEEYISNEKIIEDSKISIRDTLENNQFLVSVYFRKNIKTYAIFQLIFSFHNSITYFYFF